MRPYALLLLLLAGCGLQEIDLAAAAPRGDDVLVLDGVAPEQIARFATDQSAPKREPMLALSHPQDGAALPANVAPLTFAWGGPKMPAPAPDAPGPKPGGPGGTVYELRLRCARSELRVYLKAGELTLPADRWRRLLDGSQGAALEAELRALDDKGKMKAGPVLALAVWAPVARGSLYYVAESQGVARAELEQPGAELVSLDAPCAGCRPITRDGAVRVIESEPEVVVEAAGARATLTSAAPLPLLEWASLAPDGSRLIASGGGQLALYARDALALELPVLGYASDPDWDPQGERIALALDTRPRDMMMMEAAPNAIVRVALGGESAASTATSLVESAAPDETLHTPSFSPDGRFLAFTRQKGKGDMSVLSWIAADALDTTAAQGELATIKARAALPAWLPSTAEREYWLVFSSTRDGPSGKLEPGQAQLWALGIERQPDDSLKAAAAPFWLPSQDPATSNLRAQFATR